VAAEVAASIDSDEQSSAGRRGGGTALTGKRLCSRLHKAGINLRLAGAVLCRVAELSSTVLLFTEMITRTFRDLLDRLLLVCCAKGAQGQAGPNSAVQLASLTLRLLMFGADPDDEVCTVCHQLFALKCFPVSTNTVRC
jgi:hypothetical protein